jgi:hypothetical protein
MRLTSPETFVRRRLFREDGRGRVGEGGGEGEREGEKNEEGEVLGAPSAGSAGSTRSAFEDSNPPGNFLGDLGAVASAALDMGDIEITPPPPPPPTPTVMKGVAESSGEVKDASWSRSAFFLLALSTSRVLEACFAVHRRYQNMRKNTSRTQRANATGGTMAEASMALCELYGRACARAGRRETKAGRVREAGVRQFICFSSVQLQADAMGGPRTRTIWCLSRF